MTGDIGRLRSWRALLVLVVVTATAAGTVSANSSQDYLVRLLRTSSSFRARAQAALSLGQLDPSRKSVAALEKAAGDRHPAVRVSAISSLQRLKSKSSLPVIERATRDRNKAVRRAASDAVQALEAIGERQRGPGPVEYLVAVGSPGAKAERVSMQMLSDAREFLVEHLVSLKGIELAPDDLTPAAAKREIASRQLHGFYLESSVVTLEPTSAGVRAVVSMIVLSYPGRDMRGMLRGAATATGQYSSETAEQAIEGAFTGALRRLPAVMHASKAREGL